LHSEIHGEDLGHERGELGPGQDLERDYASYEGLDQGVRRREGRCNDGDGTAYVEEGGAQ
jgi:hypothetical protein